MSLIGDYIHYNSINYLKYGISQKDSSQKPDITKIFKQQTDDLKALARMKKDSVNIEEIEQQLNYYFDATKNQDSEIRIGLTNEDINNMREAIEACLEKRIKNTKIDQNTLQGKAMAKTADIKELEKDLKNKLKNDLEEIYDNLSTIASRGNLKGEKRNSIKYIKERMDALNELRLRLKKTSPNALELKNLIESLDRAWKRILKEIDNKEEIKYVERKGKKEDNFINNLNKVMSQFVGDSRTSAAGEYAEAVVVATNFLANATAAKGVNEIKKVLEKNIKGTERSQKGLKTELFSKDYVDLDQVVKGTVYESDKIKNENGDYFSMVATQDKVDAIIQFNDIDIATTIKNYDLSNMRYEDIHFLKGRSVLALTQEFTDFLNHYLNITGSVGKGEISSDVFNEAQKIMKLTIFLKALQGSVYAKNTKTGNVGMTQAAELLIINDNSIGRFRVFTIDQILSKVELELEKNINLLKTGSLDKVKDFNDYVGVGPSFESAKIRISKLLAKLHQMELEVSVNKTVFQK